MRGRHRDGRRAVARRRIVGRITRGTDAIGAVDRPLPGTRRIGSAVAPRPCRRAVATGVGQHGCHGDGRDGRFGFRTRILVVLSVLLVGDLLT